MKDFAEGKYIFVGVPAPPRVKLAAECSRLYASLTCRGHSLRAKTPGAAHDVRRRSCRSRARRGRDPRAGRARCAAHRLRRRWVRRRRRESTMLFAMDGAAASRCDAWVDLFAEAIADHYVHQVEPLCYIDVHNAADTDGAHLLGRRRLGRFGAGGAGEMPRGRPVRAGGTVGLRAPSGGDGRGRRFRPTVSRARACAPAVSPVMVRN